MYSIPSLHEDKLFSIHTIYLALYNFLIEYFLYAYWSTDALDTVPRGLHIHSYTCNTVQHKFLTMKRMLLLDVLNNAIHCLKRYSYYCKMTLKQTLGWMKV